MAREYPVALLGIQAPRLAAPVWFGVFEFEIYFFQRDFVSPPPIHTTFPLTFTRLTLDFHIMVLIFFCCVFCKIFSIFSCFFFFLSFCSLVRIVFFAFIIYVLYIILVFLPTFLFFFSFFSEITPNFVLFHSYFDSLSFSKVRLHVLFPISDTFTLSAWTAGRRRVSLSARFLP